MITINIDFIKDKTISLTIEEAKRLHQELNELFGTGSTYIWRGEEEYPKTGIITVDARLKELKKKEKKNGIRHSKNK